MCVDVDCTTDDCKRDYIHTYVEPDYALCSPTSSSCYNYPFDLSDLTMFISFCRGDVASGRQGVQQLIFDILLLCLCIVVAAVDSVSVGRVSNLMSGRSAGWSYSDHVPYVKRE